MDCDAQRLTSAAASGSPLQGIVRNPEITATRTETLALTFEAEPSAQTHTKHSRLKNRLNQNNQH